MSPRLSDSRNGGSENGDLECASLETIMASFSKIMRSASSASFPVGLV